MYCESTGSFLTPPPVLGGVAYAGATCPLPSGELGRARWVTWMCISQSLLESHRRQPGLGRDSGASRHLADPAGAAPLRADPSPPPPPFQRAHEHSARCMRRAAHLLCLWLTSAVCPPRSPCWASLTSTRPPSSTTPRATTSPASTKASENSREKPRCTQGLGPPLALPGPSCAVAAYFFGVCLDASLKSHWPWFGQVHATPAVRGRHGHLWRFWPAALRLLERG